MNKYVIIAIVLVSMFILSYLLKAAVVIGIIGTLVIVAVMFLRKSIKPPIKEGLTLSHIPDTKLGDTAVLDVTILPPTHQERIQIHIHGHKLTDEDEPIRPSFYYNHNESFGCIAGKPITMTERIDTSQTHFRLRDGDRVVIHVLTQIDGIEYQESARFKII